jgi:hypothetical protein
MGLARWWEGRVAQLTWALLRSANLAAAQPTRYTRHQRPLHPHIHFLTDRKSLHFPSFKFTIADNSW